MNQYLRVFLLSLLIFSFVIFTGFYSYAKFFNPIDYADESEENPNNDEDNVDEIEGTPLERAMKKSSRVNVLLIGLEGPRTDTIMVASFDRKTKELDIMSIPRDTYYPRDGYSKYGEFAKINSVYGTDERKQEAVLEAIVDLTKIPIEHYVIVEYDGVRAAVEAVGGVEFNVPFYMKYTDPYDKPPLYIRVPGGNQLINGDKAIELLRFRQGDPGYQSYPNGDLGRIKTQQEFIKAAIKKSLSFKLPSVISAVYPYVKTNFTLTELLGLAGDVVGFSTANINSITLPGVDEYIGKYSFYIPNVEEIIKNLYNLYNVPLKADIEDVNEEVEETET